MSAIDQTSPHILHVSEAHKLNPLCTAKFSWNIVNFWNTLNFTLRTRCFWNISNLSKPSKFHLKRMKLHTRKITHLMKISMNRASLEVHLTWPYFWNIPSFTEAHQNHHWGTSNANSTSSVWITTTLAQHNPLFWSPHNSPNRAIFSWNMSNVWTRLRFTLRRHCFWKIPTSRSSTHFTWSISNFIRGKSYISRKHQEIVRLWSTPDFTLKLTIPLENTSYSRIPSRSPLRY